MTKEFRSKLIGAIQRSEPRVNNALAVLSMFAVALVLSTEFVNSTAVVPYFNWLWSGTVIAARALIWSAYVASFFTYAIMSGRPVTYVKNHVLELIICLTWVPQYTEGPFTLVNDMFVLSRLVPLDMLQLIGTLAHSWRALRWTADRFPAHPIYVTGSAAALVIFTSAALLNHFEPQTFHTFWDGAWFSLTTVTTIGYGDLTPKTGIGKLITTCLIISGISLFGVVLGLTSELVRTKLLKQEANPEVALLRTKVRKLMLEHGETQKLVGRLESQNERLEAQNAEMLSLLHKLVDQSSVTDSPRDSNDLQKSSSASASENPDEQAGIASNNLTLGEDTEQVGKTAVASEFENKGEKRSQ